MSHRRALSKTEKMRRFFQTSYAAASWSKPASRRRVEASEQGSDIRFIVTTARRAKVLYEKVYCARGAWRISSRT